MPVTYVLDQDGYLVSVDEGVHQHEYSTTIPPIYQAGHRPQFHSGAWVEHGRPAKISPVQFKLLFKPAERVAIKASADPVVLDFFEIVNDPRLTHVDLALESTQDALLYLEMQDYIADGRAAQIIAGGQFAMAGGN